MEQSPPSSRAQPADIPRNVGANSAAPLAAVLLRPPTNYSKQLLPTRRQITLVELALEIGQIRDVVDERADAPEVDARQNASASRPIASAGNRISYRATRRSHPPQAP